MPTVGHSTTPALRPYQFHGLDPAHRPGDGQASADCPFCGREGKFSICTRTGQWRCFVCAAGSDRGGGNALTFLRLLWEASDRATNGAAKGLAAERKLLYPETLTLWGVCQSVLSGDWLVPGYDAAGKLHQLYRWVKVPKKDGWVRSLLPTPGLGWPDGKAHGLFGPLPWNPARDTVYLCEGPWDGMALWELVRDRANVFAVPGCNVFQESWAGLLAGRKAVLTYDSDHPRLVNGKDVGRAGFQAARRTAGLLAQAKEPPQEVHVLLWGKDGYDPDAPSGHDVRDSLSGTGCHVPAARTAALTVLLTKIVPAPADWVGRRAAESKPAGSRVAVGTDPCRDWGVLLNAWKKAMTWRETLGDVLAVMLAVALSTEQVGDQLFLQVIGEAGAGKTRLCDALLTSDKCFALEHLTGFHSGWNDGSGEDYSLLARCNRKTLVTPEGDVLMSSPRFAEIMSQQRRIFDGTSGASYKNRKEDTRYTGLRTPWIMAGTAALLDTDQSRLGDRFLRVVVDPPGDDDRDDILTRVGYTALRTVLLTSNGAPESTVEEHMLAAYRLTGGYVDHLRARASELLGGLAMDDAAERRTVGRCKVLAELTACLRARPAPGKGGDAGERHDAKELPTRLTHQFVRLACCLAVVLGRRTVDAEALRVVRKVALDTAAGRTMAIADTLHAAGRAEGRSLRSLAMLTHQTEDRERTLLKFLFKIGVAEAFEVKTGSGLTGSKPRWRLTARFAKVYQQVMGEPNA